MGRVKTAVTNSQLFNVQLSDTASDDYGKVLGLSTSGGIARFFDVSDLYTCVDNINSSDTNKPLSARQGKVLAGMINSLNELMQSDNVNLDTMQEVVDFILANQQSINSLTINNISGLQSALDSKRNLTDSISYNDLTNLPTLFDGDYNSLTNKPVLFSGSFNDLTDVPASSSFSGSYDDLTNKPVLFSGSYNDLTDVPASSGFSGDYNDLTNKPTINNDYNNLDNLPTLFDGDYNTLTNKPTSQPISFITGLQSALDSKANVGGGSGGSTSSGTSVSSVVITHTSEHIETIPSLSMNNGDVKYYWIANKSDVNKVIFTTNANTDFLNGLGFENGEKPKYAVRSSKKYTLVVLQKISNNNYSIYSSEETSLYNILRYLLYFNTSHSSTTYNYLVGSGVPSEFMTSNSTGWWFAIKIHSPFRISDDAQVLFSTNSFSVAYYGDGTYFSTQGTSGYLQNSVDKIVSSNQWLVFQWRNTDRYDAWIDNVKVLDNTSSGGTPPSTAPTGFYFGKEPSGSYQYELADVKISSMMIGLGNLLDSEVAEFTTEVTGISELSSTLNAKISNAWIPDVSSMHTVKGDINFTTNGDSIYFEEA